MFTNSDKRTTGVRQRQLKAAQRIKPGDRLVCYMTKLSRWIGVLEVKSECFTDNTPIFYKEDDPFIIRFRVEPIVWLAVEKAIPIREDRIWNTFRLQRVMINTHQSGPARSAPA